MIKGFLHTAFEVKDIEQAIGFYQQLGFKVKKQFDKPEPEAKAAHIVNDNGDTLELWQFIDKDHPQVEYIRRHVAFESDNLEEDIEALKDKGCELVIPITKGVTLTYAFVRDPDGNYIEIGQR